jgi:hypothetical protein
VFYFVTAEHFYSRSSRRGGVGEGGLGVGSPFFGAVIIEAEQVFLEIGDDEADFAVEAAWGGVENFVGQFTFYDDQANAPFKVFDEAHLDYSYVFESFGTGLPGLPNWADFPALPFGVLDPVSAFFTFDAFIFHATSTGSLHAGESFSIRTWNEALADDRYDFRFLGEMPYVDFFEGTYLPDLDSVFEIRFWPRFDLNFISTLNEGAPAGRRAYLDVLNFSDLDENGNPTWEERLEIGTVAERQIKRTYFQQELHKVEHVSRGGNKRIHFRVRIAEADGTTAVNSLNEPLVIVGSIPYIHKK